MAYGTEKKSYLLESFPQIMDPIDLDGACNALKALFEDVVQGVIPNKDYTLFHLTQLMRSLVEHQRGSGTFIVEPGSWSLISLDEGAPSDVRVDYVFFPTYYAVSLLTFFHKRYPEQAADIKGYLQTLHKGLRFAGMRQLWGHGIEGGEQRDMAVDILMRGGVPEYLFENSSQYPECRPLIDAFLDYARQLGKRIDYEAVKHYLRISELAKLSALSESSGAELSGFQDSNKKQ